ncbi:hypothetical protein ACFL0Q_07615 [Thermodesulfobacteriota bacterium]
MTTLYEPSKATSFWAVPHWDTGLPPRADESFSTKHRDLFIDSIVADIISARFSRIFKERKIDVDEFAREKGGSYWYIPRDKTVHHSDGTYTDYPRNMLKEFLEGTSLGLPNKKSLQWLEDKLELEQHSVCTHLREGGSKLLFLEAHGFCDQRGRLTEEGLRSPRVRKFVELKEQEARDLAARRKEQVEREAAQKAQKKASRLSNLRKFFGVSEGGDA